jgi:hypothetical protein
MRFVAMFSMIALLGAGCFSPAPAPAPTVSAPEMPAGHPPAVVMVVGEVRYPGVEGSYCYGGVCVDKIGPAELVSEASLPFKDVSKGADISFSVGGEVFEFGVTMANASGTALSVRVPVGMRNGVFTAKVPNVSGHVLLMANVRFGKTVGDDVSYVFPLNVR